MALQKIEGLAVSLHKGIHVIKLNRPKKKNAFTPQMYEGVTSILNSAAKDDNVIMTVLTGADDFYSSGNDLVSGFQAQTSDDSTNISEGTVARVRKFVSAFIDYPKLLIALVNGPAIGIATTTLGLCDVVYASDKSYFHTPFTQLGLVAEGCSSYLFPRIMGFSKASEVLYFGRKLSAQEAMECGLVSKVFPHATFEKEVWPKVEEFVQMPKQSMFASKRLVRDRIKEVLHKVNEEEMRELEGRLQSDECSNAVLQFLSRRSKM